MSTQRVPSAVCASADDVTAAAICHGMERINHDIDQHLADLCLISLHGRQILADRMLEANLAFLGFELHQRDDMFDDALVRPLR